MADGVSTETVKPGPELSKQPSKGEKFTNWLKSFRKKKEEPKPRPAQTNPEQFAEFIDVNSEKKFTVAGFIADAVREKGLKPPNFESQGASGFSSTNEKINPDVLAKVRNSERPPNGYIIGVGVPNIFSLLDTFPEGTNPKGIVMINTDPKAAEKAKEFIEGLKEGNLIDLHSRLGGILASDSEENRIIKMPLNEYLDGVYSNGQSNVNTGGVMMRHLHQLVKLAREGNIALIQQDILNPELLSVIAQLPNFKDLNNLVYLSNISDWIWRPVGWAAWEQRVKFYNAHQNEPGIRHPQYPPYEVDMAQAFASFNNLNILAVNPGFQNYFADTLGKKAGLNYQLRIEPNPPRFIKGEFALFE